MPRDAENRVVRRSPDSFNEFRRGGRSPEPQVRDDKHCELRATGEMFCEMHRHCGFFSIFAEQNAEESRARSPGGLNANNTPGDGQALISGDIPWRPLA